ncbi:unnamed protein product [Parajaminaea phylloscopi]
MAGSASSGDMLGSGAESAHHSSKKARGKRRAEDGAISNHKSVKYPSLASSDQKTRDEEAMLLWSQTPTGPFLDPLAVASGKRIRIGQRAKPYLPPTARKLPFSAPFYEQLQKDAAALCKIYASVLERHFESGQLAGERVGEERKNKMAHPFSVMTLLWQKQGWHLVHFTWSEDAATRQGFFESTTRAFSSRLGPLLQPERLSRDTILQATAALFALLLLFSCQVATPNPEPGIRKAAFAWARKADDVDTEGWDPFAEHGISHIKIEADVWLAALQLPQLWKHHFGNERPVEASGPSRGAIGQTEQSDPGQDVAWALSELQRRQAVHVLPSTTAARNMRNPPQLPLYDEVTEAEELRAGGSWGTLVSSSKEAATLREAAPATGHAGNLSRSDLVLVRAAQALRLPLATAVPHLGMSGQGSLQYAPPSHGKRHTSLFQGVWIDRPFRPLHLERNNRWLGDQGHAEVAPETITPQAGSKHDDEQGRAEMVRREKLHYEETMRQTLGLDLLRRRHAASHISSGTPSALHERQNGTSERVMDVQTIAKLAQAKVSRSREPTD